MKSLTQLQSEFDALESGTPRLNAIRNAIAEADTEKDLFLQYRLRYAYLKESIFCGDRYFAMIIFPQLLSLYDENEELRQDPECDFDMLVAFKWIVEAAPEFPQITKTEIDNYFRMFKRRLLEHGCSLSIYYMKRSLFYMHCDRSIAAADFYRYLDAPLDYISDGRALYHDQQVMYYLFVGNEEKALEAAKPIFSGELTSNALPQATYHDFIRFYLDGGEYEKALEYAKLTLRRVDGDPYYLDIVGTLMALYGMTKFDDGIRLFCRNYPVFAVSKNPKLRMLFTIGAYHLFRGLPAWYQLPEYFAVPKDSPIYEAAESRDITSLASYFYTEAKTLAEKFDRRNGTDDFMTMLHYEYPPYTVPKP